MFAHRTKFHIAHLGPRNYRRTAKWALTVSVAIVVAAAALARAAHNFKIALTDKPDIALYLLLPEEEIRTSEVLRESETERDYLAETKDGPKLIKLKKSDGSWHASLIEPLHEDEGIPGGTETETPERR